MKKLLLVIAAAALGGCAVAPPGPAYYGSRPVGQTDPNGWQGFRHTRGARHRCARQCIG
jgi:uncharacterized lipoprotein YmbA